MERRKNGGKSHESERSMGLVVSDQSFIEFMGLEAYLSSIVLGDRPDSRPSVG